MTTALRFAPILLLGLLVPTVAHSADLVPLSGKPITGTVVGIAPPNVEFRDEASAVVKIPVQSIAAIDLHNKVVVPAPDEKYDEIELTDGSVIRVSQVKVKGKMVEVTLLPAAGIAAPVFDLPLGSISWLMRGANDPKNRDDWKKLLAARGKRDLFVVRQAAGLNPLAGTVMSGNEVGDSITFEREDGMSVTLRLTRATGGLILNQPPKDVIPPKLCSVVDVFGNTLVAQAVELDGTRLKVKTVGGVTVDYTALAGVSKFDFSQGNVSYLSDLEAVAVYPPAEKDGPLGEQYPFAPKLQNDRALGATEIVLAGKKFSKGISVPPDTTLTYKFDPTFREFKATVGILDGVKPDNSSLKLRIEIDGREVFAETIGKKDAPREVTLNVKDAKELKLTVEREALFAGNQLNLADARLQK
ncbi:NPCBM/NEW2 domain-containing protein [Fimbriiglobus ruber]|uniref:Glycosyl hydrolase family 98, putative carbohydrate binding module n=1 Tax=Fimbriiglobus ruber TaxID=1908690 RepID=A0A225E0H1_9BACT|nr:NPCBM/NEW2 domain-containing protein [Fimbriiglobus ruber]OWK44308.1 Glycosyl hydrolase family 98, putative carbohydrate binding module [Fimbriiglobus ruber]